MIISKSNIKLLIKFLFMTLIFITIDQLSKIVIIDRFAADNSSISILPFFDIIFVINKGVSFGILEGIPYQLLLIFSIISLVTIVLVILYSFVINKTIKFFILSLICSGSIGNLIDRFLYKGVVDFICLHYSKWYFPVFNLADCMISIAVAILLIYLFMNRKTSKGKNV